MIFSFAENDCYKIIDTTAAYLITSLLIKMKISDEHIFIQIIKRLIFCCFILIVGLGKSFGNETSASIQWAVPDSVGEEVIDGKVYITYQIEPKDTYYKLSRTYGPSVSAIAEANSNIKLKIGDRIRIPTERMAAELHEETITDTASFEVKTKYQVGKKETLYAVSKRFNVPIEDLQAFNGLTNNEIKEGQILKIPGKPLPESEADPEPEIELAETQEETPESALDIKTNQYGVKEKHEKGIGVWIEGLAQEGKSNLALHKTAPIGTVLKITNPMTKKITFAKVVGGFAENMDTRNAIVVLSKSAATYIGALDRRFQIEINYGLPTNN